MIDKTMPLLGPVVLVINFVVIFMCIRPKHKLSFTVAMIGIVTACIQALTVWMLTFEPQLVRYLGLLYVPLVLRLFKGQAFQKLFALFTPVQLTILTTHIADAVTGATVGYASPRARTVYICLSLVLLSVYMTAVLRFGRRLFDRLYAGGGRGEWALYAFGSFFSYMLILSLKWDSVGAPLYFFLVLFILWSVGVLCYTIINAHDKSEEVAGAEALKLQMKAMREQTDSDKKYHADVDTLRNDMLREMEVIVELYRDGKDTEAEAAFSALRDSLSDEPSAIFCDEPVLNAVFSRFDRKAEDADIRLYVNSNITDTLPVDTIRLAVIASNALENAIAAAVKVPEPDKRTIRVQMLQGDGQIGLEVVNPCVSPVEFDIQGLPVTGKAGHGLGVRSIAAFAEQNGYLLDFEYGKGKFAMRLVMFA